VRRGHHAGMRVVTGAAVVVAVYLLLVPQALEVIASLRGPSLPFGLPDLRWSLSDYQRLIADGDLGWTVRDTATFAGSATAVAMAIGGTLAWLVARTSLPGRNIVSVLVVVPFVIPPIVQAQSYVLMLAPQSGVLNEVLRLAPFWHGTSGPIDPFGFATICVLQGISLVPFPFLMLIPLFQNMDGTLEEAARASGASWGQTLRRVTLPILWPAVLGIVVLTFLINVGSLTIPLLFGQDQGTHILALRLWNLVSPPGGALPQYGVAAAYGVCFLVFISLVFSLYLRSTRHAARRASVSGRAFRPQRLSLGRAGPPTVAGVVLYAALAVVLPLAALLWSSVTPYALPISLRNLRDHLTLSAYPAVLASSGFWLALARTLLIAAASATLAVATAAALAFAASRQRNRLVARGIDALASSSMAIPDVIAGFAIFVFYLSINRWVPLSGTIWVLILAYSYRFAVPYRTTFSGILQIGSDLEDAAAASGASRLATFRRIIVPLVLPTLTAVWIQLFILAATDFTIAAFTSTAQTQPLSMYIYARLSIGSGYYAPAEGAAAAVLFTLLVAAAAYALRLHSARRAPGGLRARGVRPTSPGASLVTVLQEEDRPWQRAPATK
jgi:iron(III) transport system permease protein